MQTADGNWPSHARSVLNSCLPDSENFDDADVMQALGMLELQEGVDCTVIYLTLLALYILAEAYEDYEDEWRMIASKAREYLR